MIKTKQMSLFSKHKRTRFQSQLLNQTKGATTSYRNNETQPLLSSSVSYNKKQSTMPARIHYSYFNDQPDEQSRNQSNEKSKNQQNEKLTKFYQSMNNSLWQVIHSYASTYPKNPSKKDKDDARMFYWLIGSRHPCVVCSSHYKQMFLKDLPFTADTRYDLFIWTWKIHNSVNQRLGKKIMSLGEAMELYHVK
jgi:hypothetical protein